MPRYYVRLCGETRGPFTPGQLRDFAEAGVLTPATEAAAVPEGPWVPVTALPEAAVIFPARTVLDFKPTKFVALNDVLRPSVDVRDAIATAAPHGRILRVAASGPGVSGQAPQPPPPNEIEAMVREVRAREAQFAPPPAPPPKRRWDYRLKLIGALALLGNLGLFAIVRYYGVSKTDEFTPLVITGWFIIGNGGLVYLYCLLPRR